MLVRGSLLMKSRKGLARDSATYFFLYNMALFIASLKQSECWAQNDSPRGRVFSSFKR